MDAIGNNGNNDRFTKAYALYGKIAREIAGLKKEYQHLEEKEKFFRSENLLHLAELLKKENDQSFLVSNQKLMLDKQQLDILQRHVDCIKKVSGLEITHIDHKTEVIDKEDFIQDANSHMNSHSGKDEQDKEKVIVKSMLVKGKIGQFKVLTEIVSHHLVGYVRKERVIPNVDINPLPDCLLLMYQTFLPFDTFLLSQFLNSVHYYQMLREEREETVSVVEETVQVKTIETTESWVLEFSPALDKVILVKWRISFNKIDLHLQHKVTINCPDEVIAFYSKRKEIFQYLSAEKELKNSSDVIRFFKFFN